MYDAGARDYFDIASVMIYGYGFSPYDRRVEFKRNNFSRPLQTREIMVRNGDGSKPIWAVEYAWVALPDGWTGAPSIWGRSVSEAEQADYLFEGYRRAQQEWPWLGAMCVWTFRWIWPPDAPDQIDNPTRGFAIVNYDFSPRPAFNRLTAARTLLDRAYTGAYAADSRLLQRDDGWQLVGSGQQARLIPTRAGASVRLAFAGTRLDLLTTAAAATTTTEPVSGLTVQINGQPATTITTAGRLTIVDQLPDAPHTAEIVAQAAGDRSLALTGLIVLRQSPQATLWPWLYGSLLIALLLVLARLAVTLR
jgi:hypothetical protein